MNYYNFQVTPSKTCGVCAIGKISWDELCNKVMNPKRLNEEDSPLWSFYDFVDKPELKYGAIRGIANNVKNVNCMTIDYDDGTVTIKDFMDIWKDYKYILYTSKSHSMDLHRFRVVIPLAQAIPIEYYSNKLSKHYLREQFQGCDITTFDRWRKQRIPYVMPHTVDYYYAHANREGKLANLSIKRLKAFYEEEKASMFEHKQTVPISYDVDSIWHMTKEDINVMNFKKNLIHKYEIELESLDWYSRGAGGDVHYTCRRIIYSLTHNNIMDADEALDFIMNYSPSEYYNEMRSLAYNN